MDEKKPKVAEAISDEDLEGITGGATLHMGGTSDDPKYYRYVGSTSDADWDASYLCPKCGRPVKYTGTGRFRCNSCDESWFFEYKLTVNTESGVWKEISREEFMKRLRPEYRHL